MLCPAVLRSASRAFGNVPAQVEGEITLLTQKSWVISSYWSVCPESSSGNVKAKMPEKADLMKKNNPPPQKKPHNKTNQFIKKLAKAGIYENTFYENRRYIYKQRIYHKAQPIACKASRQKPLPVQKRCPPPSRRGEGVRAPNRKEQSRVGPHSSPD